MTTLAHFPTSLAMNAVNSAGELPTGSKPAAAMRLITSGNFRTLIDLACSRVMMSYGVPVGTSIPYQPLIS